MYICNTYKIAINENKSPKYTNFDTKMYDYAKILDKSSELLFFKHDKSLELNSSSHFNPFNCFQESVENLPDFFLFFFNLPNKFCLHCTTAMFQDDR